MKANFLKVYLGSFPSIQGAFQYDAALLFMAYNQLINSRGIAADVLEIGVHHGLSSIAVAALRGDHHRFFAVDLFGKLQQQNVSCSGAGDKESLMHNMASFYEDLEFMHVIDANSLDLKSGDFGSGFSFCHIDGGHSARETYHDLILCSECLVPGGLLALDDYFNPSYPGVSEGAVRFRLDYADAFVPIAIGFNKVLFQKSPVSFDLNEMFSTVFSHIPKDRAVLWEKRVHLFWSGFINFFDLSRSTPKHLIRNANLEFSAVFEPESTDVQAKPMEAVRVPVRILNKSNVPFLADRRFGLSYHLLSSTGIMLERDNTRNFFESELKPGEETIMDVIITAPLKVGHYLIEVDMVWEGVMWFQDKGNPTSIIRLTVA
jgi:hypothetical protein